MTVLTEEKALERVQKSDENITYILRDKKHSIPNRGKHRLQGRKEGDTNLSDFARTLIGTAAHFDKRKNVEAEFGVSGTSISAYKRGRVSIEQVENGKVLEKRSEVVKTGIRARLDDITSKSVDRISKALDLLTDERLETTKTPVELTVVMKNLASVIEKANPKEANSGNQVQVNLFVPNQMKESDFESIPTIYVPEGER